MLPSRRFVLTVHTPTKTLGTLTDKHIKKWSCLPRSATNATIHRKDGMDIKSMSEMYMKAHNDSHARTHLIGDSLSTKLIVVNILEKKVKGLITRGRVTIDGTKESIIDFVIVSSDLVEDADGLLIDEEKEPALSKLVRGKLKTKVIQSDHNVMITKLKLKWNPTKTPPTTIFNRKNKACQRIFKRETTNANKLSTVFESNDDLNLQTKKFLKLLKNSVYKSFKRVKLRKDNFTEYEKLDTKWTSVRKKI